MAKPSNENYFKREKVKQRLLKTAAELWDYQETEMEGFDPMVDLLFGACAVQFEKTARELHQSKTRVLKRLASLLLPETLTIPTPAHAIVHAQPVSPLHVLDKTEQFFATQEIINQENLSKPESKDIFFSPALSTTLIDGSVKYMATGRKLMEISGVLRKEDMASGSVKASLPTDTLWIGLALSAKIISLDQVSFYFNWKNMPEVGHYLSNLPLTQWYLRGQKLNTRPGYPVRSAGEDVNGSFSNNLDVFQDVSELLEKQILFNYQSSFLTISDFPVDPQLRQLYPEAFMSVFAADDLKKIKEPLFWVEIRFPQLILPEALGNTICALNCFPALNRKLEQSNRPFRVSRHLNILPLTTADYLLTMYRVISDEGKHYKNVPFKNHEELQTSTFAVREEGVGRFDHRKASESSEALLNLIRDENAAFEAIGGSRLAKELKEIRQNLSRLEKLIQAKTSYQDVIHYLILNADRDENIWVGFWSTTGKLANRMPAGTKLKDLSNINYQPNHLKLITSTLGGKDKPDDREKVNAFRSALLSRDRLVTEEDIKAACLVKMGNTIKQVTIKKGVSISALPKEGFQRTIDVILTPSENPVLSQEEWEILCNNLQKHLEQHASVFNAIRVRILA